MRKPILAALLFSVLAMSTLPTARASGENYRYFVYAANYNDNNVSAYSANADTGVLTQLPGSPYAAGQYPASVTATADGECIYVTNQGDGTVSAYAVDQESGALTEIAGSPFSTSTYEDEDHSPEPVASVISPDGGRLYVANRYNNNIKVFAIGSSGALSSEGYMIDFNGVSTPLANCSVAVHPSGRYLYAANMNSRSISAFNTDTLQRLPNSPFDTGVCPRSVAVHPGGQLLYAADWGEETITGYWIGETDGSLSPVTGSPFATVGDDPTALLILGDTLYVTNGYSHNIAVYAIDTATGALTEIAGSPFESGNWPTALASDIGGAFLYVANSLVGNLKNVRGYTIDSSTGALAAVAGNPFDSGDNTMGIAVVRVAAGSPVCEIVGGMQYETLDAAIADVPASTPTTIRLLQTIERTSMLAIDGARRITLDLNGYNLNINVASGTALEVSQGSSLTTAGVGAMNAMGEEYGINTTQSSTVNITGNVSATAYAGVYAYGSDSSVTVIGNVGGYIGVLSGNTASVTVTGNVAGDNVAILATESSNIQVTGEATGTSFGVQANTNAEATVAGNVRTTSPDSTGLLLSSGAAVTVSGDVDAGLKGVSASEGSGARVEGSVTTISDAGYGFAVYAQSGARVEIGGDAIAAAETGVAAETSGLVFVTGDVQGKYYGIAVSRGAEVFVHGDVIAVLYGGAGVNAYSVGKATIDGTIQADRAMVFGESDGALVTPTTKPGYLTYSDGQGSFIWVYDPDAVPFITLTTEKAPGSAIYFTSIMAAEADLPGVWIDLNDNGVKDDGEELGSPKTVSSPTIRIYGKVTGLNCQLTGLTALDASHNPYLVELECSHNSLTSLDFSQNRKLEYLKCWSSIEGKRLESLNVSHNTELTYLDIWKNALEALDLSNNTKLKRLFCLFSELTELDLSQNAELEFLNCSGGKLVSLTLNNPKLKSLYCDRNQLAALDVSGSPELTVLSCRDNGAIASLNVSHLTKLDDFFCDDNALTSLTLPATSTLKRVTAENNRLTALDASGNTGLTYLRIHGNKLAGDPMTAFVNGLPDVAGSNLYIIDLTLSPPDGNVATKSQVAVAKGKGWNVFDFNNWDPVPYDGSGPEAPIVEGTATDDTAILQIDNKTPSAQDRTWDVSVTAGTVKEGLTAADVTLNGLPAGLSHTAAKGTGNNIVITLTGTATTALTADASITAVVRGSAVTEIGAQDSEGTPLNLWYIGADTTFVLTNEAGALIDTLIAAGHGSKNLYQVMQLLQPVSGGTITDRFMMTLASNEAASEIFTAELNDAAAAVNNPVGVNADGTLIVVPIHGRDYCGQTGYSTYRNTLEAGRELFTYAEGPQYYIPAGSSDLGTSYYAFAIAWLASPIEVRLLKPTAGMVWTGEQTIEWEAAALDHEASELKITLEYALQSEGSAWQIVAANQMNTGKYKWDTSQVGRGGRYKVRVTAVDPDGGTAEATSEEFIIVVLTRAIVAAPNPARDSVTFYYDIPADGTLHVYDIAGRLVYSAGLSAAENAHEWNLTSGGRPLANGVYLYVVAGDAQKSEVGRLVVSR